MKTEQCERGLRLKRCWLLAQIPSKNQKCFPRMITGFLSRRHLFALSPQQQTDDCIPQPMPASVVILVGLKFPGNLNSKAFPIPFHVPLCCAIFHYMLCDFLLHVYFKEKSKCSCQSFRRMRMGQIQLDGSSQCTTTCEDKNNINVD